jgi:hypothetical protein
MLTTILEVTLPNFRANLTALNSNLAKINNATSGAVASPFFIITSNPFDGQRTSRENASAIHFRFRLNQMFSYLDILLTRNGILDQIAITTSALRQNLLDLKEVTNQTIVSLFYIR